jgi:hypothetical protein
MQEYALLEIRLSSVTLGFEGEEQLLWDWQQDAFLSLLCQPINLGRVPVEIGSVFAMTYGRGSDGVFGGRMRQPVGMG